jgi:uncharacterized protein (DUF2267 family)
MTTPEQAMARITVVLQQLADRLEEEVKALAAELDSEGGRLQSTRHNAQNVARIRQQVARVAEDEGLPAIVAQMRAELPDVVAEAIRESQVPDRFAADITEDLLRVIEGQEREIVRAIVGNTSDAVATATRQAITGALDVRALQAQVARAIDVTMGQAAVALDRAVREVGDRALIAAGKEASEALEEGGPFVYVYTGPDDAVTRPYCDARVGRYLTQAQADALDPRERFNCRHVPSPVPLAVAEAEGIEPFKG